MSLISCSEIGKLRKTIYLTDEEEKELIKEKDRINAERQRELEFENYLKLTESVEKRFQNDIKKIGDVEMIDSYDYIALRVCSPYTTREIVKTYGQFDYYIRSKNVYENDKQFMELFNEYLYKNNKTPLYNYFGKEYELLKEELYYMKIGKMERSFTYSENQEYNDLRSVLQYSDTEYNYNRLISFLKDWDDKFWTREEDEKRKNNLIEQFN